MKRADERDRAAQTRFDFVKFALRNFKSTLSRLMQDDKERLIRFYALISLQR